VTSFYCFTFNITHIDHTRIFTWETHIIILCEILTQCKKREERKNTTHAYNFQRGVITWKTLSNRLIKKSHTTNTTTFLRENRDITLVVDSFFIPFSKQIISSSSVLMILMCRFWYVRRCRLQMQNMFKTSDLYTYGIYFTFYISI